MTIDPNHPLQRLPRRFGCVLILAIVTSLAAVGTSVAAELSFCTFGSGAGQCKQPYGVAVDRSTGHVYVVDQDHDRVNVFEEDGDFLLSFGSSGSGTGQFTGPAGIAVDNDPTSPAFHDIYVVDRPVVAGSSKPRVQR